MKMISATIRPGKVDAVKAALEQVRICALTVTEVRDHAPQAHGSTVWRGHVYDLASSIKYELRFVVHDDDVDDVVDALVRTARTGEQGDGHVSVMAIDRRFDIRTGASVS
jgi:nitrogen regulatory protein P-II 1